MRLLLQILRYFHSLLVILYRLACCFHHMCTRTSALYEDDHMGLAMTGHFELGWLTWKAYAIFPPSTTATASPVKIRACPMLCQQTNKLSAQGSKTSHTLLIAARSAAHNSSVQAKTLPGVQVLTLDASCMHTYRFHFPVSSGYIGHIMQFCSGATEHNLIQGEQHLAC